MRYLLALLALLLIAASCGDDAAPSATPTTAATPTPTSPPTPTPTPNKDKGSACDNLDFPTAGLNVGAIFISAHREAINWNDPIAGCAIAAHPFGTLILPATAVPISARARLNLNFTRTPTTITASAWPIDIDQLTPDYQGDIVEVANYVQMRQESLVSLDVQPTAAQKLVLTDLTPGDTIIEIRASWPEGDIDFIFRLLLPDD